MARYGRAKSQQQASEEYLDGKSPDLNGYRKEVEQQLLPELKVSRQLYDIFHMCPSLFVGIERRTSILWPALERMLQGETTYVEVARDLGRLWPLAEFVSDAIRGLPPLHRVSGLPNSAQPERFFRRKGEQKIVTRWPQEVT